MPARRGPAGPSRATRNVPGRQSSMSPLTGTARVTVARPPATWPPRLPAVHFADMHRNEPNCPQICMRGRPTGAFQCRQQHSFRVETTAFFITTNGKSLIRYARPQRSCKLSATITCALPQRFVMQSVVQAMQFVVEDYHKLESGRHTRFGACGHRSEARSSVAERCQYMAEEGVRILPRLPGRPVPRV